MSYASPSDVVVELGRPAASPAESDQWQAWLDRVERRIARGFRRAGLVLDDQIALGDPLDSDVIDAEVAAVIRKIQNPTWGKTSTTRSVDDASITDRNDSAGDADPLDLLEDEWDSLLPGTDAQAFSTRPGFEADFYSPIPQTTFNATDPAWVGSVGPWV